ncbi:hypothetical protein DFJ63DRAFT_315781 [Scheffersomyces coipomensis]|uniref:uncharacterized protein n=1 Tax=Scheffersomyces coipomensis TaxID=1788519 RepID=UPI00315D96B0
MTYLIDKACAFYCRVLAEGNYTDVDSLAQCDYDIMRNNEDKLDFESLSDQEKLELLEYLPNDNKYDEKFKIERQKLVFMILNFDMTTNRQKYIDIDYKYIDSYGFPDDVAGILRKGTANISKFLNIKNFENEYYISVASLFENIFYLGVMFNVPFPITILQPTTSTANEVIPSSNYQSRSLFEKYAEIYPLLDTSTTDFVENLKEKFHLRISQLLGIVSRPTFPRSEDIVSERDLVKAVTSAYLDPMLDTIKRNSKVNMSLREELVTRKGEYFVKPDVVLKTDKKNIPVEVKRKGLFSSLKNIKELFPIAAEDDVKLIESNKFARGWINQLAHQCLFGNSNLGFALDNYGIFAFQINSAFPLRTVIKNEVCIKLASIAINGVNSRETKQTIGFIFLAATFVYSENFENDTMLSVCLNDLTLTSQQEAEVLKSRYKFTEQMWMSRFRDFKSSGRGANTKYINNQHEEIELPIEQYKLLRERRFFENFKFEEFEIVKRLTGVEKYTRFASVYLVKHRLSPDLMILKVYDANRSRRSKRSTSGEEFYATVNNMLLMYSRELLAYTTLRGLSTSAIGERPISKESESSEIAVIPSMVHNIPNLISTGYIRADGINQPAGNFLLLTYIQNDFKNNTFTEEEKIEIRKKCRSALKKIHEKGLVHGDIHPGNILYQRANNRVYFIDFGYTTYARDGICKRSLVGTMSKEEAWKYDERMLEIAVNKIFEGEAANDIL